MSDDEDYVVGGQIFGASYADFGRAQGAIGEEFNVDPKTEEGKWNIKVMALSRQKDIDMKFADVKDMASRISKHLNLNPYTFVLAYKIVNFKGDEPIDKLKLKAMKKKLESGKTPTEAESFSTFMELSDVIRYAYLIRATHDRTEQVLV